MQLVEINEPGVIEKEDIVVGIDFGTTNSLIAYSINCNPKIIGGGEGLVPSVISYDLVGEYFKIGNYREEKNTISSIKRLLAKSYEDIKSHPSLQKLVTGLPILNENNIPKISFKNSKYSFPELASKIFTHLKNKAEEELGEYITKAVISIPAYFDDAGRGAVLLAAKLAGFEVQRLIAEPTAAAYAYGFHKKPQGTYMVYDLGGGTFDVSILNMQEGIMQVIATGGDNLLGGDDIDYILAQYLAELHTIKLDNELIYKAKKIKENISNGEEATEITKETFQELTSPLIFKTIKIAKDTLLDATTELDGIILVGGSTRIPFITDVLKKEFNVPIFSDIDPDKAVVIGAALQGENLSSKGAGSLLIDVTPLSLGLELYGGIAEKIILRNTPIPYAVTKSFTTHVDNQSGMKFHIVQGEREMVKDCRSLSHFELNNIPPLKAGMAKIEVTFALDADGILSITAKELFSGIAQNVEIKPTYGFSQKEINKALENAFENAKIDYENRLLIEAKLAGESLILNLNNAMLDTPNILNMEQKKHMDNAIKALQNTIISGNREDILIKIENLNKFSTNFIEQHLDQGVNLKLKGKHINDI